MEPKKEKAERGKSRETADQTDHEPTSLTSRIASSAAGLARDLIAPPSGNEIQDQLSSASGLSSKLANGSSSSTSQSAWGEGLPSHPGRHTTSGSAANAYALNNGESFRSTPNDHTYDQEFNDFLNGNTVDDTDAHYSQQRPTSWTGDFQTQSGLNDYSSEGLARTESIPVSNSSQHPGYDDGAEVRLLLSDPSFQPAWEESEVMTATPVEEDTAMDLFGENYSPEEQRAADRIKSALPPPPVHEQVSAQNPLNLRPDFKSMISHMQSELDSDEVSNIEGLNTPRREELVAEWDGVLNGYTDEVWGDMLPAVKEARTQLQEVKAGSERLDNKAVTRLKMILGHVVQSADPSLLNMQTSTTASTSQDQALRSGAVTGNAQLGISISQGAYLNGAQMNRYGMGKEASVQTFNSLKHSGITVKRHHQAKDHQTHQLHNRKDSPMGEQGRGDDLPEVAFHCPWISCHERFNNALELRLHTSAHTQYACPHQDCTAEFKSHEEWADHIEGPHHDLLDTRLRTRRNSVI